MNHHLPFFSVVMPTYNRANLLPLAIESVLRQTVEDFELIVCNGGSTDNTAEVVKSFDDSRIRYVEAERKLSIGENYNLALSHASGEYITFLGDDDAFVSVMFERVKKVIEKNSAQVVGFRFSNYYHDIYIESYDQTIPANTLQIQKFTGEITEFKATEAIKNLFKIHGLNSTKQSDKFIVPYLANAIYHNSIFSRIKTINKNPFAVTPADMYMAAAVFFATDSYFCLDTPLHVWSRWSGSSTALAYEKGNTLRKHYEKLLGDEKLQFTPLTFAMPHNCAVNAILQAKHDFEVKDIEVDWFEYYLTTYENLMYLKSMKIDVSRELLEFDEVLAQESDELKRRLKSEIGKIGFVVKQFLRGRFPSALHLAKKFVKKEGHHPMMISGNECRFENVLQASDFLARNFLLKR